ncbi:MAG TPA: hypothetical protein VEJ87_06320 [Acidimicrobiales bacterium]|nr:hypothetical protein [Acidimicrobiales bacterium]
MGTLKRVRVRAAPAFVVGSSLLALAGVAGCGGASPRLAKHPASLARTSVTPEGWVRVRHGKAQISVPGSWSTIAVDCPWGREPGVVIQRDVASFTNCTDETGAPVSNEVRIAPLSPPVLEPSERRSVINGIEVYWGLPAVGMISYIGYQVPSLGVQIDASGPLARRVLNTLTRS